MAAPTPAHLHAVLAPVVGRFGVDLDGVDVRPAGRRRLVRVVVDRDGGVDLDTVADISQAVSDALDADAAMGESAYVLEVTSPGVDRPLTQPRHWRRAVGRLVECTLTDGTVVTGRLISVDGAAVVLDVAGHDRALSTGNVSRAVVQVEFSRRDDEEA